MSYVLDALRKLEERDALKSAGAGRRLGGGPPHDRPPRGNKIYLLMAGAAVCAVAIIALLGIGGREVPDENALPPASAPTAETAGEMIPEHVGGPTGELPVPAEAVNEDVPAQDSQPVAPADAAAAVDMSGFSAAEETSVTPVERPTEEERSREEPPDSPELENVSAPTPEGDASADAWDSESMDGIVRTPPGGRTESSGETGPEEGRVYAFEELPAGIQADLPELVITGHIYSEDAAFRLLMVSDDIKREGETVSPGLILKEITGDGAHLAYKGYLFSVSAP